MIVSIVTVSLILAMISEAGLYTIGDSSRVKSLMLSEYMPRIDASKSSNMTLPYASERLICRPAP